MQRCRGRQDENTLKWFSKPGAEVHSALCPQLSVFNSSASGLKGLSVSGPPVSRFGF